MPQFYEFFAGGGMARAGLGRSWTCTFANDFDPMKARTYRDNWGHADLVVEDVAKLTIGQLPNSADLSWASFPCQDLSLAGSYAGIGEATQTVRTRSGTFWPFWSLMKQLNSLGRGPRIIALENVWGILRSNRGRDFKAIASAFSELGYRFGALVVDAKHFLPQSRPRVFIIGVRCDLAVPGRICSDHAETTWHPAALIEAYGQLSEDSKGNWLWWSPPPPQLRKKNFDGIIRDVPEGVEWHTAAETERLLNMMSERNREKVESAKKSMHRRVGAVYKRTRVENGTRVQRAEVRFDDVAGCLRTPAGGSSRQTILLIEGDIVKSRLLAPREAADLMGLPESYILPLRYNDAYHVAGDGVAVPVVSYLSRNIFEPILQSNGPVPSLLDLAAE